MGENFEILRAQSASEGQAALVQATIRCRHCGLVFEASEGSLPGHFIQSERELLITCLGCSTQAISSFGDALTSEVG